MEASQYEVLLIINNVLVFLHGVALLFLLYNSIKYIRKFPQRDPYTIATLVFLGLSVITLVVNLPWSILSSLSNTDAQNWANEHSDFIVCCILATTVFSRTFFTLAISTNSARWALLSATVKWSAQAQDKMMKYIRIGVVLEVVVLLSLSTADAVTSCLSLLQGKTDYTVKYSLEYTIDSLLLVVHALCIVVYITAYKVLSAALRQ
jgi:hypothetical protein